MVSKWARVFNKKSKLPDTKTAMAKVCDQFGIFFGEYVATVVHENKVIPRCLIFIEGQNHGRQRYI